MENNPVAGDDDTARAALRRMRCLSLHLAEPLLTPAEGQLVAVPCARAKRVSVANPASLAAYMKGKHWDVQLRVFEFFTSRPDLHTPVEISMADHRELSMRQLRALVREGGVRPFRYVFDDPGVYFAIAQAAGCIDMSLGIKMGVQYR